LTAKWPALVSAVTVAEGIENQAATFGTATSPSSLFAFLFFLKIFL
jgi:hypothetical protein